MSGIGAKGPPAGQTVLIRDLELAFSVGILDSEKQAPQRVRLTIEMYLADPDKVPEYISETVDYGAVVNRVKALAAEGHIELVETLADRIHDFLAEDPLLAGATVVVEKPDIIPEAAAVGVRVVRYYARG